MTKNYDKRPLLKKYSGELIQTPSGELLKNIAHDFSFNTRDYRKTSNSIAKQFINIINDNFRIKTKSGLSVYHVDTSKDFAKLILNHLPFFMRKDPLIIEIAKAVSKELQRMDLKKKEKVNSLSLCTNVSLLERSEKIYKIKTDYSLGVAFRQNRLIAREITRYETFNKPYILKISKLFNVGKVLDVINDKTNKVIEILLEENIYNIKGFEEYKNHIREFSPAFYTIIIRNQEGVINE